MGQELAVSVSVFVYVSRMLLPLRCPRCRVIGPAPCERCVDSLHPATDVTSVAGCDAVAACFRYDHGARDLLLALKYRNRQDALEFLAAGLVAELHDLDPVDVICWAPTSRARVRERGFDQAELLACATARMARLPARRLLRRTGAGHQTGRSAAQRREGAQFVPIARRCRGERVLLVDDIATTGSTLAHAAAALRSGGAYAVQAVVVAWTPAYPQGFA